MGAGVPFATMQTSAGQRQLWPVSSWAGAGLPIMDTAYQWGEYT